MPTVPNLPCEFIVRIFSLLDDIDAAFHLARCNRELHAVLRDEANYLCIMRSIVVSSYCSMRS